MSFSSSSSSWPELPSSPNPIRLEHRKLSDSKGRKHEASNPLPDWEAVREVRFPPPIFSMRPLVFQKGVFYLSWVILHNAKKYIHTHNTCYSIKCFFWSQVLYQYLQLFMKIWQLLVFLCKYEHKWKLFFRIYGYGLNLSQLLIIYFRNFSVISSHSWNRIIYLQFSPIAYLVLLNSEENL